MKVEYFIPPPAHSRGGIDLALEGMIGALEPRNQIQLKLEGKPDKSTQLVHFHGLWNPSHLPAYAACRASKTPYIVSPHGMLEPWAYGSKSWKKWPWMQLFGRRQLGGAAATLATSQMEADNLARVTRNVRTAPLGLDVEVPLSRSDARRLLGIADGEKIVLYLSRIDRKKGLDLLVRAMRDHPDWALWIIGDGDEAFARELRMLSDDRVRWFAPAWKDDRWPYLLAADLFCLPSHSENFGFAILEALWCGTPTLTTTKTPWVAHRDIDGLTVCEDTLDSLRAALMQLLPDLRRPQSLAPWARRHFHWNQLTDRYQEIYEEAARP